MGLNYSCWRLRVNSPKPAFAGFFCPHEKILLSAIYKTIAIGYNFSPWTAQGKEVKPAGSLPALFIAGSTGNKRWSGADAAPLTMAQQGRNLQTYKGFQ